jgi:hypothetical protein
MVYCGVWGKHVFLIVTFNSKIYFLLNINAYFALLLCKAIKIVWSIVTFKQTFAIVNMSVLDLILAHLASGLLWSGVDRMCGRLHLSLLLADARAMWASVSKVACSTAYLTVMWTQGGALYEAGLWIAQTVTSHKFYSFPILGTKVTPLFTSCRHE